MTHKTLFAVLAALSAGFCAAQATETAADDAVAQLTAAPAAKFFATLPVCSQAEGIAEVKIPGQEEWLAIEAGHYYPLGASFRVAKGGRLTLVLGRDASVSIFDKADFALRPQALGENVRTIVLGEGEVDLNLPMNLPTGVCAVAAPGFAAKDLAGESKFTRRVTGDGDEVIVRCVTGSVTLEGSHYTIPAMHAADEIKIRTSADDLETFLYGTSGDYIVNVDQGVATKNIVTDDGDMKTVTEKSVLPWHLSVGTKVRISRRAPAIGTRLSVTVMTFDTVGQLKHHYAFAEGRAEVNSGELVKVTKEEGEALAKRTAEVTEGTAPAEEESDNNDNEEEE